MTRRTRRSSDRQSDAGLGMLLLLIGTTVYRWVVGLTLPWSIALISLTITTLSIGIYASVQRRARRRRERLLRDNLYALGDREFEEAVGLILQDLGWNDVQQRGGSGDRGVDLSGTVAGMSCIVQCKRYKDRVGPEKVRELIGTLHNQRADRAYLITTGRFTDQGYQEAHGHPIELWDGQMLAQQMQRARTMQHDPVRSRRQRHRQRLVLGSLALVNVVVVSWALLAPAAIVPRAGGAESAPTSARSVSSLAEVPAETSATAVEVRATTASVTPLHATVSHGGNIRAGTTLEGNVIDLVEVGETLPLLAHSADGIWYRVTTPRAVTGWVHRSLLTLPPDAITAVPVDVP